MLQKSIEMENKPIVLVGLMGVGKTSLGRTLARAMNVPFIDTDLEIERVSGMSVIDIFSLYGEKEFRRIEADVFERIINTPPLFKVISTGEGAFITPSVCKLALKQSITIWLKADLELLAKRTSWRDTRPQLLVKNPADILAKLMEERYPIYAKAKITIETSGESKSGTLKKIFNAIGRPELFSPTPKRLT